MKRVTKRIWVAGLALSAGLGLATSAARADLIYSGHNDYNFGKSFNEIDPGSGGNGPNYFDGSYSKGGLDDAPRIGGSYGSHGNGGPSGGGFGPGGRPANSGFNSSSSPAGSGPIINKNDVKHDPVDYNTQGSVTDNFSRNSLTSSAEDPAIPEPATLAILGAGLMGLGIVRRRRRK